jgi:hypothetical protein
MNYHVKSFGLSAHNRFVKFTLGLDTLMRPGFLVVVLCGCPTKASSQQPVDGGANEVADIICRRRLFLALAASQYTVTNA